MFSQVIIVIFCGINLCYCVPPSPTDSLLKDVNEIKSALHKLPGILTDQKTNRQDLEQRLLQQLTGVDSNVKNLQERAHVWDTFQLHVSAWNDQLSTTDRKLDILSKAQEKFYNLDTKLNNIPNLEYKLDTVLKKLEETDQFLQEMSKKLDEKRQGESLFGEFATRGILSTLKQVEKKLDRLHLNGQNILSRQLKQEDGRIKNGKCNIQPMDEMLRDISSKVDVIFDKFEKEDIFEEDYLGDAQSGSGELSDDNKQDVDLKLLRKVLRRLHEPCKQTNKALENILSKVKGVENSTNAILKKNGKGCRCADIFSNVTKINEDQRRFITEQFTKQNYLLADMTKTVPSHYGNTETVQTNLDTSTTPQEEDIAITAIESTESTTQATEQATSAPNVPNFKIGHNGCHWTADSSLPSGVVHFGKAKPNEIGRDYNTRYCENGWTVIQRRDTFDIEENFNRSWTDYKNGFGDLERDFWFGNEFIHQLSVEHNMALKLRIELEDFDMNKVWSEYSIFRMYSEADDYRLYVGDYSGTASDSFSSHNLTRFSTYDRKNDDAPECCPCALSYGGGWWFNSCFEANLNGLYYKNPHTEEYYKGIIWESWLGNYSLKMTKMMVKPVENRTLSYPRRIPFIEEP